MVTVAGCLALATLGHLLVRAPSLAWAHVRFRAAATCGSVPLRGDAARHAGPLDVRVADGQRGRGRAWRSDARPAGDGGARRGRPLADPRPVGPARAPRPVDARLPAARPHRHPLDRGGAGAGSRTGSPRWPDVPVVGWGHRSASWDRQPTVRELDEVTGVRPVVLISGDGHHAWLNAVAMRGLRLPERDGVVSEARVVPGLPAAGRGGRRRRHLAGRLPAHDAAGRGEGRDRAGRPRVRPERPATGPSARPAGAELLRVRVGAYVDTLDDFLAAGLRTGRPMPGCGPLVTMGPLKIISDGSLNTRTAWCCSPYATRRRHRRPEHHQRGPAQRDARTPTGTGLEVAVHAIGDAAVERGARGVRGDRCDAARSSTPS